ncbi:MAG TPA: membrane dipeptidase [Chthoniobacterales bacterium]|jgi:membrane dipeptidase
MTSADSINERIALLHVGGIIDLHYDLPLGLFLQRARSNIIPTDFLPQFEAGDIGLLGVALYVEDEYLPNDGLRVALDQVALLQEELKANSRLALCRSFSEIEDARRNRQIALLLTMEGVEPLGHDLHLVRIFYELGLRVISFTHARENAAAAGGIFAARGSPAHGLTNFGRELVEECQRLGLLFDLAHINPAGFEEICSLTTGPLIVSHSNARHFYDIERNISDEQIRIIGTRGGVIGINAILVSPRKEEATLDRYVDHIEHVASLIGIDGVGLGFDFCQFLWRQIPPARLAELEAKLARPHFLPDLSHHGHARNLTRKLIERGFNSLDLEKILRGNWLRVLRQVL